MVQATPLDAAAPPLPDLGVFTDRDGRFFWPLRAGSYRLQFLANGSLRGTERVTLRANDVVTLRVTLSR